MYFVSMQNMKTIYLTDKTHVLLKVWAAKNGMSMVKAVEHLVTLGLNFENSEAVTTED